jgi:hypothetical protein
MTVVVLKYTAAFGITSNANGLLCGTAATFQPSSTFEPFAGQTSQPYGRDQMAALYGKYKVLDFSVAIDTNVSTGSGPQAIIIQMLHQPPTGGIDLAGVSGSLSAARPNVTSMLPGFNVRDHYERKFRMHELLGITKKEFDADVEDYAALVGANPAQMPTLKFYVSNTTDGTQSTVGILVTLIQRVQFFGRIGQTLS